MNHHLTAVFMTPTLAVRVITDLQALGVVDSRLSLVTKHTATSGMADRKVANAEIVDGEIVNGKPVAETAQIGLLAGAGLGTLVGLGAVFVPDLGPLIAAGAFASTLGTMGVGALAGALIGVSSGVIAGALNASGYPEHESRFYGTEIEHGAVLVSVDLQGTPMAETQIHRIFALYGGRSTPVVV